MGETILLIDEGSTMVKIEVNTVLRSTVHPVENRPLVHTAAKHFMAELAVPVLTEAELYGGKLVAALDRQHPSPFSQQSVWPRETTRWPSPIRPLRLHDIHSYSFHKPSAYRRIFSRIVAEASSSVLPPRLYLGDLLKSNFFKVISNAVAP